MRFIKEFNLDLTKTEDFLQWIRITNEESILNREDDTKWLRRKNIPFENYHSELDGMIEESDDPKDIQLFKESKTNVDQLIKGYGEREVIDELIEYYEKEIKGKEAA